MCRCYLDNNPLFEQNNKSDIDQQVENNKKSAYRKIEEGPFRLSCRPLFRVKSI